MLYRAKGFIIPPKPYKKRRFILEVVRHPSGAGLQTETKVWFGNSKRPCLGYMYSESMKDAKHYFPLTLRGRNPKCKIVVTRQTKGRNWL
jgi:hypothetical protein